MSEKDFTVDEVRSQFSKSSGDQAELHAIQSNTFSINEIGRSLSSEQKFFILDRLEMGGLVSLEDLPPSALYMIEQIEAMNIDEAFSIIEKFANDFKEEPNYPVYDLDLLQRLIAAAPNHREPRKEIESSGKNHESFTSIHSISASESLRSEEFGDKHYLKITDWDLQVRLEASLFEYWSPFPEVRAVTEPFDDPTIACETVRVYIIGIIWCGIGEVINQFFIERQPSIKLKSSIVQVFIYPCGLLLSYILPKWKFKVWKYTFDLNPGPWTSKEQMLCTLFYSAADTAVYSRFNILVQKLPRFYNNTWVDFGYELLLTLSTQFMGFGFAGFVRRFAVYPVTAVWPYIMPTLALNKTLISPEKKQSIHGWTISRYNFFLITFAASFVYFWLPNYLFKALSLFNWLAWIKPDNFNLATITGSQSGLGLNPIPSFDWNVIGTDAFSTPFYSTMSTVTGATLGMCAIAGVYYTNHKWTAYLPINSNLLFTNKGKPYNVKQVVDKDSLYNNEKYQEIGPPYYSAGNLVVMGAYFAMYPFAFLYEVLINYRAMAASMKSLFKGLRNFHKSSYADFDDPFSRMMSKYPEVPEWMFTIVMVLSIVLGILALKLYPTETPVWGIFFAVGMNFVYIIPMVSLASVTGFTYSLSVLVELIIGYALPGNGLAMSIIKAFGTQLDLQSESYITNQKMAHYAKIPPRALFRVQMLAVFVNTFVGLGIMSFQMTSIKDFCTPHQAQRFTCPGIIKFYSSSVIWGVIGPKRVFDGLYPILKYCFLIGFLLAPVCAAIKRFGPRKYMRYFQPTVIIGGFTIYAPYNLSYHIGSMYVGFISMVLLKGRYPAFWGKYNYLFACGILSGIAFSGIIIFFSVQYHPKKLIWWGNTVNKHGYDYAGTSLLNATESAPDGYFGPRYGHYP